MSVKWLAWPLTVVVVGLLVWLGWAFLAAPIAPAVWQPPANPGLTGPFSPNSALATADTIGMPELGPEDVACGSDGRLYTGLEDGRIVGFSSGGEVIEIGRTAGRPLGLMLDAQGDLIIADAYQGLLRMGIDGAVETLVAATAGGPCASSMIWTSPMTAPFTFPTPPCGSSTTTTCSTFTKAP